MNNNQDETSVVLQALDQEIAYYQEKITHLQEVKKLYEKNSVSNSCNSAQHDFSIKKNLNSQLVNEVLDTWPMDKTFSGEDIFQELNKNYKLTYINKRSASAMLCTILSRQTKNGKLRKIDRGCYQKVFTQDK